MTCGIPSLFTRRTPNSAQRPHVFTRVTTSGNLSGLVAALGAQSTSRTLIIPTRPSGIREADDGVLELWEAGAAADGSQDRRVSLWEAGAAADGSQDVCIN